MATEALTALSLQVERCKQDPTRYRWDIRDHDCRLRQCLYPLPDEQTPLIQGQTALQEAHAVWCDAN